MWTLQTGQKKILCSLLGVHPNARHDVIEGITNCPKLTIHCQILRTRRAENLQCLWSQDDSSEHALVFALNGFRSPELIFDPDLLPLKTSVLIRADLHFRPITISLSERHGGFVTIGTLRWLPLLKLPDDVFRTLLLWIFQRWRIFGSPKLCQHCQSPFTCQYHVASCAGLRFRNVEECPVASLELEAETYLPEAVIKNTFALIMEHTLYAPALARSMLAHIESSIQESLVFVFGSQRLVL